MFLNVQCQLNFHQVNKNYIFFEKVSIRVILFLVPFKKDKQKNILNVYDVDTHNNVKKDCEIEFSSKILFFGFFSVDKFFDDQIFIEKKSFR